MLWRRYEKNLVVDDVEQRAGLEKLDRFISEEVAL
jgi:hypothetical protein